MGEKAEKAKLMTTRSATSKHNNETLNSSSLSSHNSSHNNSRSSHNTTSRDNHETNNTTGDEHHAAKIQKLQPRSERRLTPNVKVQG